MSNGFGDDRTLREVREAMRAAASKVVSARHELEKQLRRLEAHPDFARTERRKRPGGPIGPALTLAWWLHNCVSSALHDGPLEEVNMWLVDDAYHAERTMRQFIESEARDLRRQRAA